MGIVSLVGAGGGKRGELPHGRNARAPIMIEDRRAGMPALHRCDVLDLGRLLRPQLSDQHSHQHSVVASAAEFFQFH